MVAAGAILAFLILFHPSLGFEFLSDDSKANDDQPLPWPETIHLKGEIIDMSTSIVTPFEYWLDGSLNRSRIDSNNGTSKVYYHYPKEDELGYIYYIIPKSEEDFVVEFMCMSRRLKYTPDFLPSREKYTKIGTKKQGNKNIEIWSKTEKDHLEKTEETISYVKKFSKKEKKYVAIPVQHENKKFNLQKGSWEDHTITNYYNADYEIPEDTLDIDKEECDSMNGNFKDHVRILEADNFLHLDILFESYSMHHSKNYNKAEYEKRKRNFHKNWKMVTEHNKKNLSYKLELNQFSDKTPEELAYLSGTHFSKTEDPRILPFPHTDAEVDSLVQELPREYDLRIEGMISPVKNQGSCGSCWAFCTAAALEGAFALKNGGRDLDLSEQSLVDCAWAYDNGGCMGGDLKGAMNYVLEKGIPTDREYGPYLAEDGICHRWNTTKLYQISGFAKVTARNNNAMKLALYKYGPVVAGIHASDKMSQYSNGIFYDVDCNDDSMNHGITVVGYGERDGDLYWIVKNSWGESWGEDGYILLSANDNNCFLTDEAYYVVV